jgi:hypothetical protein
MSACPLCRARKGKRVCPARGETICAACCGAKRRVEIDCPEDCVYLSGAHAGAWDGRETERRRDIARVAPFLEPLGDAQAQLFFLALAGLVALRAQRRELDDRLLHDALRALRKTVETRRAGVLYEHPPEDARALGLLADLEALFEARAPDGGLGPDGTSVAPADADLAAVVTALEAAVAQTRAQAAGATAFLDTAVRLAGRLGAPAAAAPARRPLVLLE